MTVATRTMAKKKSAAPKRAKAPVKRVVIQLKGSEEWKAWLDLVSRRLRMPASSVVDNALVMYAKAQGIEEEAPER